MDKEIMEIKRRIIELEEKLRRFRRVREEKTNEPWLTKQKRR